MHCFKCRAKKLEPYHQPHTHRDPYRLRQQVPQRLTMLRTEANQRPAAGRPVVGDHPEGDVLNQRLLHLA